MWTFPIAAPIQPVSPADRATLEIALALRPGAHLHFADIATPETPFAAELRSERVLDQA